MTSRNRFYRLGDSKPSLAQNQILRAGAPKRRAEDSALHTGRPWWLPPGQPRYRKLPMIQAHERDSLKLKKSKRGNLLFPANSLIVAEMPIRVGAIAVHHRG